MPLLPKKPFRRRRFHRATRAFREALLKLSRSRHSRVPAILAFPRSFFSSLPSGLMFLFYPHTRDAHSRDYDDDNDDDRV